MRWKKERAESQKIKCVLVREKVCHSKVINKGSRISDTLIYHLLVPIGSNLFHRRELPYASKKVGNDE